MSDHLPELFDARRCQDAADARSATSRRCRPATIVRRCSKQGRSIGTTPSGASSPSLPTPSPARCSPTTSRRCSRSPGSSSASPGQRLIDQLRPDVLDPLGIGEFRWAQTAAGGDVGFSGVYTDLDAVARLGQLYLDDGVWDGRRLLPGRLGRRGLGGAGGQPRSVRIPTGSRATASSCGCRATATAATARSASTWSCSPNSMPWSRCSRVPSPCRSSSTRCGSTSCRRCIADELPPSPADDVLARRLATLSLPTVAERRGGGAPDPPAMTFRRAAGVPSHPTVTDDRDERPVDDRPRGRRVDRGPADRGLDASRSVAGRRARRGSPTDGSPSTWRSSPPRIGWRSNSTRRPRRSSARWPLVPLFGAGAAPRLASMQAPPVCQRPAGA